MINKSTKFGTLFPFGPLINISLGAQVKYFGYSPKMRKSKMADIFAKISIFMLKIWQIRLDLLKCITFNTEYDLWWYHNTNSYIHYYNMYIFLIIEFMITANLTDEYSHYHTISHIPTYIHSNTYSSRSNQYGFLIYHVCLLEQWN